MNIDQVNRAISFLEIAKPNPVADPRVEDRNEKLKKASQDFESLFLYSLMKNMRRSVPQSGLLGGGLGGEYFRSLFDEAVAKAASRGGGMGLWEMLYTSLSSSPLAGERGSRGAREQGGRAVSSAPPLLRSSAPPPVRNRQNEEILGKVRRFNPIIQAAAERYAVNPRLIQAVIAQESKGNPNAVSPKGAKGLMQLMDETAGELGVSDVTDPRGNIFGGTRHLRRLLDRFEGNVRLALAAYNAGIGAVEKYRRIPPYKETTEFVEHVMHYFRVFEQIPLKSPKDRGELSDN